MLSGTNMSHLFSPNKTNTAKLTHFGDDGATIAIDVSKPASLFCYDLYVVITSQKIHIKPIVLHGHHEGTVKSIFLFIHSRY
jgi:hypothetical protein